MSTEAKQFESNAEATDAIIHKFNEMEVLKFGDGIDLRRAKVGELVQTWIEIKEGFSSPLHRHDAEQSIVLITGKLRARSGPNGSEIYTEMGPGDIMTVPGGVMHQVDALEDSVFVEAFGPGYDTTKAAKSPQQRKKERAEANAQASN